MSRLASFFRSGSSSRAILPFLAFLVAFALSVAFWAESLLDQQGLRGFYYANPNWSGEPRVVRIDPNVAFNSNDLRGEFYDRAFGIEWMGWLHVPRRGEYKFIFDSDGGIQFFLGGRLLLEDGKHARRRIEKELSLDQRSYSLGLRYFQDKGDNPEAHIYLYWQMPDLSEQLISRYYFYTARPSSSQIESSRWASLLRLGSEGILWLALVRLGIWVMGRFRWRSIGSIEEYAILGIFLLAFLLRGIYLLQIKDVDPHFDQLWLGRDQLGYEYQARGLEKGYWPGNLPFYFHPFYPFFLFLVHRVVGESLLSVRVIQALLGSFLTLIIYYIGRKVFNPPAAFIAASLAAVYGVFIFYDGALLPDSLAMLLDLALLAALFRAQDTKDALSFALAGFLFGISALTRGSILLFLPLVLVWMLVTFQLPVRRTFALFGVLVAITLLTISPATLWNYRTSKQLILTAGEGGVTLFIGNNPYASGVFEYSSSFTPAHTRVEKGETTWEEEILKFIEADPMRWVTLSLRKLGLFWGNTEIGNNVDYVFEGKVFSPLLRLLPLDFRMTSILGLAGMGLSLAYWRKSLLLYLFILTQVILAMMIFVVSRFRLPIVPPLMIFGGWALYWAWHHVRHRQFRSMLLRGTAALLATISALQVTDYLAKIYPPALVIEIAQVPTNTLADPINLGDQVKLLAFDPYPERLRSGSYLKLTLYWQAMKDMEKDYSLFIHLIGSDGKMLAQSDTILGMAGFGSYLTSQWQPGQIIRETYFVYLPKSIPNPISAEIRIGVYLLSNLERLPALTEDGEWVPENALSLGEVQIAAS